MSTTVPVGTPITTHQAVLAVLREIRSPILGDVNKDPSPGYTLARIYDDRDEGRIYDMLSGGERRLADIALGIWDPTSPGVGRIGDIGGLDRTLRRKVLVILFYLHLGRDLRIDVDSDEFGALFAEGRS